MGKRARLSYLTLMKPRETYLYWLSRINGPSRPLPDRGGVSGVEVPISYLSASGMCVLLPSGSGRLSILFRKCNIQTVTLNV